MRLCRALGVALVSLAGCASDSLNIRVKSASNVNDQRSVYVLVRTVQEADYRMESYDEVAARVVHPDDSVQEMAVALPGVPLSFTMNAPPKTRVAVYALFERPVCGAWRVLLPKKAPPNAELRLYDGKLCLVDEQGQCVAEGCNGDAPTELAADSARTP